MSDLRRMRPLLLIGTGLIVVGVGPLLLAELARRMGFNSVGFGLMWGLTFGAFLSIAGIAVILVAGIAYLIRAATKR